MNTIYLNDFVSIVGVISTVFGIVTGYLFKKCTKDGRLIFYLKSFSIQFLKQGLHSVEETNDITDFTNRVNINFRIDLLNSPFEYKNPHKFHLILKGEYVEFRYEVFLNGNSHSLRLFAPVDLPQPTQSGFLLQTRS